MKFEFEKQYWNRRYGGYSMVEGNTSGYGSYGVQLEKKLNWLKGLEGIETITEIGCGDFNFGRNIMKIYPQAKYFGYDISKVIIDRNKELFPQHTFSSEDIVALPSADLLLCVDVLLHVIEDEDYERLIDTLFNCFKKYLVVTAYERDEKKENHVRIRKFDYKRFGEPILREIVEENGQMYFYIFKK